MAKVKTVRVFSFGKFQAVLMAPLGLIAGILYSFGGAIYDVLVSTKVLSSSTTPGVGYGTALAFLALIGMPIMFAAFGFIVGLLEAVLYNLFARWFDGLEIDFVQ
jgi:hypothetical protein